MDVKIREIKVKVADVTFNQDEIQAQREMLQFFVDNASDVSHEQQKLLDAFEIEPSELEEEEELDEDAATEEVTEETLTSKALRQSSQSKLPKGVDGPKGRVRGSEDRYQLDEDEATDSL